MIMPMQLPSNAPTNGWYNVLSEPEPPRQVSGTVRVPWVVLGAGLTGLSAARQLATHFPTEQIALIEAERVGFGTSGRSSGFVLDMLFLGSEVPFADPELAKAHMRLSTGGVNILRRLVTENDIECGWHDWGKLHVSAGPEGDVGLEGLKRGYETLGVEVQEMNRDEVEAVTGSTFYTAGLKNEGTALVNPAALCRGLAKTLPPNVTLYENTPVHQFERGTPNRLLTANGEVVADQVILCTNVFSPALGFAKSDMAPVVCYASLTRRMTALEQIEIGGDSNGFGLLPAAHRGSTVRRTPDGRILIRNTWGYGPRDTSNPEMLARAHANQLDSIKKRWPKMQGFEMGVEIEHTWGGVLGITRNAGHVFGEIENRIWGSIGCNGANVARGTMSGALLADMIVGNTSDLLTDQQRVPRPKWLPPDPLRKLGAHFRIRNMEKSTVER
jgi:glycine/D-amino acid oxidase-like deaminating enzyme